MRNPVTGSEIATAPRAGMPGKAVRERKLSPKETRFALAYCRLGGTNGTQAAIAAGYTLVSAAVTAHKLLRKPEVLQAIKAEVERSLRAGIALGADVLAKLAADDATPAGVRFQCATALLDRGGLRLANLTEHHHVIEDRRTDSELIARIEQLSRDLGLAAKVIPGESIRLDPTPAGSSTAPVSSENPVVFDPLEPNGVPNDGDEDIYA